MKKKQRKKSVQKGISLHDRNAIVKKAITFFSQATNNMKSDPCGARG